MNTDDSNNENNDQIISISYELDDFEEIPTFLNIQYESIITEFEDIFDQIGININNNTISIVITLYNFDNTSSIKLDLIIDTNYNINELIKHLELYYLGNISEFIDRIENDTSLITNLDNYTFTNLEQIYIYLNDGIDINDLNIPEQNNNFLDNLYYQIIDDEIPPEKITPETLENIPKIIFSTLDKNKYEYIESLNCSICSDNFNDNDEIRLLNCKHFFHVECIDKWLLNYCNKCPVCKQ